LFLQLTSLTQTPRLTKLIQSPFGLHDAMIEKIQRETRLAAEGKPARIIAKMNSLVEPQIIEALYRASLAGVQVDLIVRGLCALRPGIPGVSENIRVRSIVGRLLEHSRVFYFQNGSDGNDGSSELYLASADWMERNFFRRVEIAFPVREQTHRDRILRDLNSYLADNTQAWKLERDGSYSRCERGNDTAHDAQGELLARYAAGSAPVIVP
jgi:polyphosphate kinase